MAGLFATSAPSMIPATRANAAAVRSRVADIPSAARGLEGQAIFENLARSVQSLQSEVNAIMNVLRKPIPQPSQLAITDQNGKLITWIGSRVVNGVLYQGLYSTQAYFGGSDPTNANITINGPTAAIVIVTGTVTTTLNNATDALYGTDGFVCRDSSIPGKTVIGPQAFAIQGNDGSTYVVSITAAGNNAGDISLSKVGAVSGVALHASTGQIVVTDGSGNQVRISGVQVFSSAALSIQSTGVTNLQPGGGLQINGGATASGTVTYVKTVNFAGQTVTTGTITFSNGLCTAFT